MAHREIKKIDPSSLAKVLGVLYAILGVIVGLCFAAFGSLISSMPVGDEDETARNIVANFFGIGSIFFFPIFYGIIGLVGGVISAFLYNVVAGWVGGVQIEVEDN